MKIEEQLHLTYCTNIHPGNEWNEVKANTETYGPQLKKRISPDKPFGLGLRLSNLAAEGLLEGDNLREFRNYLDKENLYVFTLNGFPYGPFHRESVKEAVHEPDWRTKERGDYTIRLARILSGLLPENITEGSISTSPLSYKPWVDKNDPSLWEKCLHQIIRVVLELIDIRKKTGNHIHIDLEPEPGGLLEESREVVDFFENHLLKKGVDMLSKTANIQGEKARQILLDHICICLDTCHMAIEYENALDFTGRLEKSGIKIGKVQISSALKIPFAGGDESSGERESIHKSLLPFVESTYLHQVIQKNIDGSYTQYKDLPEALAAIKKDPGSIAEWRVHFHVPVFVDAYASFLSTQEAIIDTLKLLRTKKFTRHLEIETYTWEVLPAELKTDIVHSISREFEWVLQTFPREKASASI